MLLELVIVGSLRGVCSFMLTIEERLERIEGMLQRLVERETVQEWYSTDQVARILDKAEFTVREWARLGRIRAEKRKSGRGAHNGWAISHSELVRYQKEGLLPIATAHPS